MSLFTIDAAVIALGATVLRMVAVSEPFFGVAIILEGMLQGTGNTMAPFVFNIIGMWGVRILGTFVCTRLLGVHDRAQPAAVPAAADLLPARQVEPADPRITRRTAGKLQM